MGHDRHKIILIFGGPQTNTMLQLVFCAKYCYYVTLKIVCMDICVRTKFFTESSYKKFSYQ